MENQVEAGSTPNPSVRNGGGKLGTDSRPTLLTHIKKMPTSQLSQALERVWKSERQLGEAFFIVADRAHKFYELQRSCTLFGHWSFGHAINLDEFMEKYGSRPVSGVTAAHSSPPPDRADGNDLHHQLQELLLLAQQTRSAWTVLAEAAQEAGDDDLIGVTVRCAAENDRQIIWLNDEFQSFSLLMHTRKGPLTLKPNQANRPL